MKGFIEVKAFVLCGQTDPAQPHTPSNILAFADVCIAIDTIQSFQSYNTPCNDGYNPLEVWSEAIIYFINAQSLLTLDTYDEIKHKIEKAQKGYCIKEVFKRYEEHVQNADFVEVVRCKDCVHLKQTKNGGWCKLHNTFPLNDYYCANGKKELK